MKSALAATMAVAAGLVAANMLGVAAAEAPTTASAVRTVNVVGVATLPIAQGSNAAEATAVYRQGMADAVADGQSKAEFLASKAGATLASVQGIVEDGGSISCTGGAESGYVEYQGEQPDFPSQPASVLPVRVGPGVAAPTIKKPTIKKPAAKRSKPKRPTAKKAAATGCTLSTQVSLTYTIA